MSKPLFKGELWSLRFWITFHVSQLRLPSFPKLPYCPKYPRTDKTPPSDGLVPGLWLRLIWPTELRFLDYFACDYYDLWYFDPVSQIVPCPKHPKASTTQLNLVSFYTWVRPHQMKNSELKTLDDFFSVPVHDLGYLIPVSNDPVTLGLQ